MIREDFLKAFAEMSPGDQEAIRKELVEETAAEDPRDSMEMCREIMEEMKAGGDPMTVCKDMMRKLDKKCCG